LAFSNPDRVWGGQLLLERMPDQGSIVAFSQQRRATNKAQPHFKRNHGELLTFGGRSQQLQVNGV
jgi:hypothetical protein